MCKTLRKYKCLEFLIIFVQQAVIYTHSRSNLCHSNVRSTHYVSKKYSNNQMRQNYPAPVGFLPEPDFSVRFAKSVGFRPEPEPKSDTALVHMKFLSYVLIFANRCRQQRAWCIRSMKVRSALERHCSPVSRWCVGCRAWNKISARHWVTSSRLTSSINTPAAATQLSPVHRSHYSREHCLW